MSSMTFGSIPISASCVVDIWWVSFPLMGGVLLFCFKKMYIYIYVQGLRMGAGIRRHTCFRVGQGSVLNCSIQYLVE